MKNVFFFLCVCFFFFFFFFVFLLLMYTRIIMYGLVKTSLMPLFIFWITFFIRFATKPHRQTVGIPIVLPLLQICFYFVMKEISSSLSHGEIRLTLVRFSISIQDSLMIYQILIIFTLTKWWIAYTLLDQLNKSNSSDTETHLFGFETVYI